MAWHEVNIWYNVTGHEVISDGMRTLLGVWSTLIIYCN